MALRIPVWRLIALICLALGLGGTALGMFVQDPAEPPVATIHVAPLVGVIGPASSAFITDVIDTAEGEADIVVIEMDTPGGLVDAMREINLAILSADVPVIVYVSPPGARATSAGAYILYASHVAAMSPGTTVGAATPVSLGPMPSTPAPGEPVDEEGDEADTAPSGEAAGNEQALRNKAVNDSVAMIRSLAELRGRNADWAETAVRDGVSLTAQRALEENVVDYLADDLDSLLAQIDGLTVTLQSGETVTLETGRANLERVEPGFALQFLSIITNPNIAFLLINLGFIGLLASFYNGLEPVTLIAGLVCLILGLYGLNTLPVNYAGAALIAIGLGMLVAEVFVTSYGFLAIAGLIVFSIGALMLVDSDIDALRIDWRLIAVVAVGLGGSVLAVLSYGLAAQTRRVVTGRESLIGMTGDVLEWDDTAGFVHVDGERWAARSADTLVPGDVVRVTDVKGLELAVTRAGGA